MKYIKAEMDYYGNLAKQFKKIDVLATECLTFGIHKPINYTFNCRCSVSHGNTGYLISHFKTKKHAKLFIERVVNEFDWKRIKTNKGGIELTRDSQRYIQKINPLIAKIYHDVGV